LTPARVSADVSGSIGQSDLEGRWFRRALVAL